MTYEEIKNQGLKEFDEKYGAFDLCDIVSAGDRERLKLFLTTFAEKIREEGKILAVLDFVPSYKTKEQFEMFIDSREKDIKVLKETIGEAKDLLAQLKK